MKRDNTPPAPETQSDGVVEIPLTRGYITIVDAIDSDLALRKMHCTGSKDLHYAEATSMRKGVGLHRIIFSRILGRDLTSKEFVDHRNGNGLDNRRANLRLATYADNNRNCRKSAANTSGYKGVHKPKDLNKWRAQIRFCGKTKNLGCFNTPEEAYAAYCEAAKRLFGEFARLD